MITMLKPVKAQKLLRLMLENVARYRNGSTSYSVFYQRAVKFWALASKAGFEEVEPAYKAALNF